jgi:hypothetical protein
MLSLIRPFPARTALLGETVGPHAPRGERPAAPRRSERLLAQLFVSRRTRSESLQTKVRSAVSVGKLASARMYACKRVSSRVESVSPPAARHALLVAATHVKRLVSAFGDLRLLSSAALSSASRCRLDSSEHVLQLAPTCDRMSRYELGT